MNVLQKLIRADETRKTRFHTSSGQLCLDPGGLLLSTATVLLRRTTGRLVALPWLTLPAIRYLRTRVDGAVVFEFSAGMSTVWYARRCKEIHSVEDNRAWFEKIAGRTSNLSHVHLRYAETEQEYVGSIDAFPDDHFDVVSIDGSYRLQCYERALRHLKSGGLMVVDNTDSASHERLVRALRRDFPDERIHRFPGYPPGNGHPTETTICRNH